MLLSQLVEEEGELVSFHCPVIRLPVAHSFTLCYHSKKSCWLCIELWRLDRHIHLLRLPVSGHERLHCKHTLIQVVCNLILSKSFIKPLLVVKNLLPYPILILRMCELLNDDNFSLNLVLLVYLTKSRRTDMNLWKLSMEHDSSLCKGHAYLLHNSIRWSQIEHHLCIQLPCPAV